MTIISESSLILLGNKYDILRLEFYLHCGRWLKRPRVEFPVRPFWEIYFSKLVLVPVITAWLVNLDKWLSGNVFLVLYIHFSFINIIIFYSLPDVVHRFQNQRHIKVVNWNLSRWTNGGFPFAKRPGRRIPCFKWVNETCIT